MPPSEDIRELMRLTRENNKMLHKMNRRAVWGGIIKFILYAIFLVGIPLWAYMIYLAPIVEQMQETYEEIQGTGARANAQLSDFQKMIDQFKQPFSGQ